MKHRASVFTALAAFTVFVGWQSPARAQIALGSASSFEVIAGAGITVAGAVNSTTITGDIGTYPTLSITGLGNVVLTGVNHAGDSVTQSAKTSLVTAYGTAAGATPTTTYPPIKDLGGLTLPPGVYNDPSSFAITGLLQLDAAGDPNAVWIFQAGSTLTAATCPNAVYLCCASTLPVLPKSPMGEAITYTLNQCDALCVYTTDGALDIDNNVAERALRPIAVGRGNWLFMGSDNGGNTAAVLFTFVATCERHRVNPFAYLRDVLTRIAAHPMNSLAELLPDRWQPAPVAPAVPV